MIKSVKILGIDYPVAVSEIHNAGELHNLSNQITISSANSKEHAKSILLHEIIEAINYRMELKLKHAAITQLETSLFSVLKENPGLLKLFR